MDMQPVSSSNIQSMGHDTVTKQMEVEFKSGAVYVYQGVEKEIYETILSADSIGSEFNKLVVKGGYPYERQR